MFYLTSFVLSVFDFSETYLPVSSAVLPQTSTQQIGEVISALL